MILDFHTHVFPSPCRERRTAFFPGESAFESIYSSPGSLLVGAKDLIHAMDQNGVDRAVIFGFPWEKEDNYRRNNDYILEAVDRYRGRLTGFCCFSPLSKGAASEAERCLEAGLSGIGELAVYGSGFTGGMIDHMKDVMDLASGADVPVLVHTNEPIGHSYPGKAPMTLPQIYSFLKAYPINRIVLAHWGGGIFFYSLMKKEVGHVLKNVWFDTAASPFLYRPAVYRLAGELIGYDKILFGSDYPLLTPQRYFTEISESGIPSHELELIKGLNAARLLEMSSPR